MAVKKWRDSFRALAREESGAVSVIVAVALTMLLGCAALAVDLGTGYHVKIRLQNAVDSAAYAAGNVLPVSKNVAKDIQSVEDKVVELLEDNEISADGLIANTTRRGEGVDVYTGENLKIQFTYSLEGSGSTIWDAVRIEVWKDVDYGFAKALGQGNGVVYATAKVTSVSEPVKATINAISVYILQSQFEAAVNKTDDKENIQIGDTFTITINSGGATNENNRNNVRYGMGILHIVPFGSEGQYCLSNTDNWASNVKGDPIFFMKGYWQYKYTTSTTTTTSGKNTQTTTTVSVTDNTRLGIAVGDTRPLESTNQIYENAYECLQWRCNTCKRGCTANELPTIASALKSGWTTITACKTGCSWESHDNTCPRIVLLPVVSVAKGTYVNERGTTVTGNVGTIQYFVPIYIESVEETSGGCIVTARYIDGYREKDVSDTPDTSTATITSSNAFVAGTSIITVSE